MDTRKPRHHERGASYTRNAVKKAPRTREQEHAATDPDAQAERPNSLTQAIIDIDLEILKKLVQRSKLVKRIRGGKEHASTPRAIQDEKAVRSAWAKNVLSFSKDPKVHRDLFTLLQEVKMLGKDEVDSTAFTLAPVRQAVQMDITGPSSDAITRMCLALVAGLGQEVEVQNVMFSAHVTEFIALLQHNGTRIDKTPLSQFMGAVKVHSGAPAQLTGKTLYAGESALSLYLLIFLAINGVGVTRLTGGNTLKAMDLSGVQGLLPLLGARLAYVVPKTKGLPVTVESSGLLPERVEIPHALSLDCICALLIAAIVWNKPLTLDFSQASASIAATALAAVRPVIEGCNAQVELDGVNLVISPAQLQVPASVKVPLDPALSGYLLALPAFTGGQAFLQGVWPEHAAASYDVAALLRWAGLQLEAGSTGIGTSCGETAFTSALHGFDLCGALLPLYVALTVKAQHVAGGEYTLPYALEGKSLGLAKEVYERLGLVCDGTLLSRSQAEHAAEAGSLPWASPDPYWSLALALVAFLRPGLRLLNAAEVTAVFPPFWMIMNSLPQPYDPGKAGKPKEEANAGTTRRRVIAE